MASEDARQQVKQQVLSAVRQNMASVDELTPRQLVLRAVRQTDASWKQATLKRLEQEEATSETVPVANVEVFNGGRSR